METIETVLSILLILFLGFCGVFAPMLMPIFVKDEYKDRFPRYMDSIQPPYVFKAKWFKPKGIILQRMALAIWIPVLVFAFYMLVSGQIRT